MLLNFDDSPWENISEIVDSCFLDNAEGFRNPYPDPTSSIKIDPDPPPIVDQTRDKVLSGIEFKKQLEKRIGINLPKKLVYFLHDKVCKSLCIRRYTRSESRSVTLYYQNFASLSLILIEAFHAEIVKNPYLIL